MDPFWLAEHQQWYRWI